MIMKFLEEQQYDIRVSGNGRWIDQKCAFDAVCFVADCIMDYIQNGGQQPFQSPDIWRSEYAITNVQNIFANLTRFEDQLWMNTTNFSGNQ